ncbi:hypothetical protein RHMOL_Rhmol12G0167100 [Rhododendron molle]|uniref:Uncharacterized protein n=1 Tax=Rhododendron molle TaxID=49168 RepID=A0ACC0LKJ5_RHOML|nr:hypothetical protein RHMOL_Rhmol12G0167100 [Rhododendron molle]
MESMDIVIAKLMVRVCLGVQFMVLNVASRQPIIRASVGNGILDGDQVAYPLPAHSPQLDGQVFVEE